MKPEAPETSLPPTTPGLRLWSSERSEFKKKKKKMAPSLELPAPSVPTRAPRRGNRGKAAKNGPLDRAAESWTDRELTECLHRNPE